MPAGRPSDYSLSSAIEICTWLAEGKSLKAYCDSPNTPGLTTVFQWLHANEEFAKLYARAREEQGTGCFDDITEIGLMLLRGEITSDVARVLIDAKKWQASKLSPKRFGDKQQVEHSGSIGTKVIRDDIPTD